MLRTLATVRDMPLDCFAEKDGTPLLKNLLVSDLLESFKLLVQMNQDLTVNALPLLLCGAEHCTNSFGCASCIDCSSAFRLCSRCAKHRCSDCVDPMKYCGGMDQARLIMMMASAAAEEPSDDWGKFLDKRIASFGWVNGMACCLSCNTSICFECLDNKQAKKMLTTLLIRKATGFTSYFLCDLCYWAEKPCTNPSCPNEVGLVSTKRCGGCRIDRYCSVECQAAAYPEHVERCQKIGARLVASGLYEEAGRGCQRKNDDAYKAIIREEGLEQLLTDLEGLYS